ncbi:MAG: VOC family protein [Rhodospirillales bacterium]|nr:VOC family protein [Rhodospirillales bacterium]
MMADPGLSTTLAPAERIARVGFTVAHLDRSIDFYQRVLSLELVETVQIIEPRYDQLHGIFAANARIAHLCLGEQVVELTEYVAPPDGRPLPVPSRSNDLWFQHIAIVVSDMDEAYRVLQQYGVRQTSPQPQTIPASNAAAAGIRAIKFRDPDGHNLELLWFPAGKGEDQWHRTSGRLFLGIDHTAITVGKTDASLRFYRDLLGMGIAGESLNEGTTQEYLDNVAGARVRVTSLKPKSAPPGLEFLEYEAPIGGRPMPMDTWANDLWHWQTTMVVGDVDAVATSLRIAGVRFVSPGVIDVSNPALGFSRAVMVLDPDGHAIRLVQP